MNAKVLNVVLSCLALVAHGAGTSGAEAYVELTGEQAFVTGFFFGPDVRVELDFQPTATLPGNVRILGDGDSADRHFALFVSSQSKYVFGLGDAWATYDTGRAKDQNRHIAVVDAATHMLSLSGEDPYSKSFSATAVTEECPCPIVIGSHMANRTATAFVSGRYAAMRVYSMKIFKAGTLVRHYRPCRQDDVLGLRDGVSGQFIQPTGLRPQNLLAGGDVPTEVGDAYVENVGALTSIDTGYQAGGQTRIVADFAMMGTVARTIVDAGAGGPVRLGMFSKANASSVMTLGWIGGNAVSAVETLTGSPGVQVCAGERHQFDLDLARRRVQVTTAGFVKYAQEEAMTVDAAQRNSATVRLMAAADGTGSCAQMRLYGCRIYEGTELVRDFVPYIKDGCVGLRDSVTGVFVTGATKVALRAHGHVQSDGSSVEDSYLLSTGAQLLNTGYLTNPRSRIVLDFAYQEALAAGTRALGEGYGTDSFTTAVALGEDGYFAIGAGDRMKLKSTGVATDLARHVAVLDCETAAYSLCAPSGGVQASGELTAGFTKTADIPLGLFGSPKTADYSTWMHCGRIKIYSLKIYEGGEIVHAFYPYAEGMQVGLYDIIGGNLCTNVTGSAADFEVGGAGYDGCGLANGFVNKPVDMRLKPEESGIWRVYAPGAVAYRWCKNGIELEGESGPVLLVSAPPRGRSVDTYSVTPLYRVCGVVQAGSFVTANVTRRTGGFVLILR